MIWPLAGLALFGLFIAGKAKPKTDVKKLAVLGPRSGETWDAELFPEAGLVVVHSRRGDKTVASFHRTPAPSGAGASSKGRFTFGQAKGVATIIAMMREDFEGDKPPV